MKDASETLNQFFVDAETHGVGKKVKGIWRRDVSATKREFQKDQKENGMF